MRLDIGGPGRHVQLYLLLIDYYNFLKKVSKKYMSHEINLWLVSKGLRPGCLFMRIADDILTLAKSMGIPYRNTKRNVYIFADPNNEYSMYPLKRSGHAYQVG